MRHKVQLHLATDEVRMSARARAYLAIAGLRHLLVGMICVLIPGDFYSVSYQQLEKVLAPAPFAGGIQAWGGLFIVAALILFAATLTQKESHARFALILSVVLTMMWAGGFVAALVHGQLQGPLGPIPWFALAAKDLVVCAQPLRAPFEPLVQRFLKEKADVEQ